MSKIPFQPFGDRIVILPDEREREQKHGDIILLQDTSKEITVGTVVAVGDSDFLKVACNMRVVYSPWAGFNLAMGGKSYKILNESEILGALEEGATVTVE